MGIDFNIDVDFNEDAFQEAIAEQAEALVREHVENEVGAGRLECDCGARSFDVETWKNGNGDIQGGAVCRECNERTSVEVDTSDLDDLRG